MFCSEARPSSIAPIWATTGPGESVSIAHLLWWLEAGVGRGFGRDERGRGWELSLPPVRPGVGLAHLEVEERVEARRGLHQLDHLDRLEHELGRFEDALVQRGD